MDIKKYIKSTLTIIITVLIGYYVYDNIYSITNKIEYIYVKYLQPDIKQTLIENEYKKNENYEYVKINNNTILKNKEDIKNAIYTYLDAGWDKYIIRCDADYLTCTNDVKEIVENKELLTNISNFVHPFNTFEEFNTEISHSGKITFKKNNKYTNEQIEKIDKKINDIYEKNYDPSKNVRENIKIFHDYIINNTKYDSNNKSGLSTINSSTAYGVLFEKNGICSGYADTMSLFLEKMNIKNYRVSSDTHIWNLVYIEGEWKHLDLTWDDPLSNDNKDNLTDEYFLISQNELLNKDNTEHSFDTNIYKEGK